MNFYGDDWRYAQSRLQNSVVAYKDCLVRVDSVDPGGAYCADLTKPGNPHATYPLAELDVRPLRLGFVNYGGVASYICRAPVRRDWKQGIRHATMRSLYGLAASRIPFKCINNTHLGIFPKVKTCLEVVDSDYKSKAWSRDWAIDRIGNILYRGGTVVGKLDKGEIKLHPQYLYLQESLEHSYEKG